MRTAPARTTWITLRTRAGGLVLALGLAVATAIALASGATTSPAQAARPAPNGKVVFQTNRDGNPEIYTMNADGTNRVDLTRNPAVDITPHWSGDGRRIAFVSNRAGSFAIYTMNADGTGTAMVPSTGASDRWPTWIGKDRILFQRGTFPSRDVYVVNADGTGLTNMTPDAADSAWATAAPHGPSIALSRYTPAEGQRLYTLNTDNGDMKLVTAASPDVADAQANWSPKGNDLVFARFGATDSDLFLVRKNGTGLRQLTDTPGRQESQPAFSADGTKIVFHACVDPGGPGQHCANYAINADGSGEVEITLIPTAPYVDTFSGDRVDPFWHTILLGNGSQLVQTNGRVEETFAADATQGGPFNNINAHIGTNCKLTGDFDAQADFSLLAWPNANGVQVTLNAFEPGSQVLRESQVWGEQYATWISPTFSFVPTSDTSGSLRLTRVGTTVTGYYRNGLTWVQIAAGTTTLDDTTLGLSVSSDHDRFAHQTVNVAWDNFRINSGTLSCPTWWDDSVPDWQPVTR